MGAVYVHVPAEPVEPVSTGVPTPVVGNVSVIVSGLGAVASGPTMLPGPLLTTVIVQVMVPPRPTVGVGDTVLVIARS